jgi:hypothetical protein
MIPSVSHSQIPSSQLLEQRGRHENATALKVAVLVVAFFVLAHVARPMAYSLALIPVVMLGGTSSLVALYLLTVFVKYQRSHPSVRIDVPSYSPSYSAPWYQPLSFPGRWQTRPETPPPAYLPRTHRPNVFPGGGHMKP